MKQTILIIYLLFTLCPVINAKNNLAIKLDGADNKLAIGLDTISNNWTLEAWIRGENDTPWKDLECIIAGGEYSKQNTSDHLPLAIKKGKLYTSGANILSSDKLEKDKWIHIAAACNGSQTFLYINGKEVAKKDTCVTILPGAIGIDEDSLSVFNGMIDEIRIWKTAIQPKTLNKWKSKTIDPSHPDFHALKAYYTFDDWSENICINRVSKGYQSHHIRSGRLKQYGNKPLATTQINTNQAFKDYNGKQRFFNSTVIASEWESGLGEKDQQIVKLRIITDGETNPLILSKIRLDLTSTETSDLRNLKVYDAGCTPRTDKKQLIGAIDSIKKELVLYPDIKLKEGINYFLITGSISKNATIGNHIKIEIPEIVLSGESVTPDKDVTSLPKVITEHSRIDSSVFSVLQWNIWHGGLHVGENGQQRIIELIKATKADIVLLQESYGIQKLAFDSLKFNIYSASASDNLSLYSRFPIRPIATKNPFYSNPAIIKLPDNRNILIDNIWIRYAYRPEYTCCYGSTGLNPEVWCKEDSILGLKDIQRNIELDIEPNLTDIDDVIIGGDFNSCSHLDWTNRAAKLHNGYAASFPISRYMYEQGFIDTFRAINTNEILRGEGTFAPIYGHLPYNRIDFIYSRCLNYKPIFSRIVRTAPEIDDVWPSDHAAVLTIFKSK